MILISHLIRFLNHVEVTNGTVFVLKVIQLLQTSINFSFHIADELRDLLSEVFALNGWIGCLQRFHLVLSISKCFGEALLQGCYVLNCNTAWVCTSTFSHTLWQFIKMTLEFFECFIVTNQLLTYNIHHDVSFFPFEYISFGNIFYWKPVSLTFLWVRSITVVTDSENWSQYCIDLVGIFQGGQSLVHHLDISLIILNFFLEWIIEHPEFKPDIEHLNFT